MHSKQQMKKWVPDIQPCHPDNLQQRSINLEESYKQNQQCQSSLLIERKSQKLLTALYLPYSGPSSISVTTLMKKLNKIVWNSNTLTHTRISKSL